MTANECIERTCDSGTCGEKPSAVGTHAPAQTTGDCQQSQCDGAGKIVAVSDAADVPDDGDDCTDDVCTDGVPTNPLKAAGSACGLKGALKCDDAGKCVGCLVATDCPGQDTECQERSCTNNACGVLHTAKGTPVAGQTAGDCKAAQCDGKGRTEIVTDDDDVPADGNDCTDDMCTGGVPTNPTKAANTACGVNGALKCDDAGICVGCLVATDCAGQDTECQVRSCTAKACGVTNTAKGTPVLAQTAGDCKASQCDGNGLTEIVIDNADVPAGSDPCTKSLCAAGVPSNPPEPASTVCSEGSGTLCDGAGKCVACLVANDCPGQDTECLKRACNAGVCGTTPTAVGTRLASQTAGDCKLVVCDGSGSTSAQNEDTDVANDNNACTTDVCTAGVPSHPNLSDGTSCGTHGACLQGACTGCGAPSDCPGVDDECKSRTCTVGVCGFAFTASGSAVLAQVAGNCQKNQCDGTGNTVSAADNSDAPADDGNQCTSDVCAAGAPSHPAKPTNTACSQNGGSFCSAAGACVVCNAPTQCAGTDTDCQTRSCTGNSCGFSFQPAGTMTSAQTAGDCQVNQCDGAGNVIQSAANTDAPADDGNQCTSDVCVAGAPSHPAKAIDTACNQNGGSFCSAFGTCAECNAPTQCAGTDTECHSRTCNGNACGQSNAPAGTATSAQTSGDCQTTQCDGAGNIVSAADDSDAPADDGNQCTTDVCTAGVPSHPNRSLGAACSQGGGSLCDGAGACVAASCSDGAYNGSETDVDCGGGTCPACPTNSGCAVNSDCETSICTANICAQSPCSDGIQNNGETGVDCGGSCNACPQVVGTSAADGATNVAVSSAIAISFNAAMRPSTLTAQTTSGACSGSIQVSTDSFATCLGIQAPLALSGGNSVVTLTPAPGLSFGSTYKIQVTTAAQDTKGNPVASYLSPTGFTTAAPVLCMGSTVVISQIYGGGGLSGATYTSDFIELHNRGNAAVNLAGWSVQYASAAGSFTSSTALSGTIPAGGYYLIKEFTAASGAALPSPDATGTIAMGTSAGKVALVNATTLLGASCSGATVVDLVSYGIGTNCFEGAAAAPAPTPVNSVSRAGAGCTESNSNSTDFALGAVSPHNSATTTVMCACASQTLNESNSPLEADYCALQFPMSLSVQTGTSTPLIYARLFEPGVTPPGGASSWTAQVGYGPTTVNPESQSGWTWFPTTYNVQLGNDDEYQGSFTAPAPGTYRYTYRFSSDGANWTYCDFNGAGANAGLTFETTQLPTLSVTP
jgi:hypothetical protein